MAKVTSKLQVTVPKAIADQYNIRPGDTIDWFPAGAAIRVVPQSAKEQPKDVKEMLRRFDQATERHRKRAARRKVPKTSDRGWTREDLYTRGLPD